MVTCVSMPNADNCNGEDPNRTVNGRSCATDGQTIASFVVQNTGDGTTIEYVELRWSNTCKSNWVRITSNAWINPGSVNAKLDNYCSGDSNFQKPTFSVIINNPHVGDVAWTPMIYAPNNHVTVTGWALGYYVGPHCY